MRTSHATVAVARRALNTDRGGTDTAHRSPWATGRRQADRTTATYAPEPLWPRFRSCTVDLMTKVVRARGSFHTTTTWQEDPAARPAQPTMRRYRVKRGVVRGATPSGPARTCCAPGTAARARPNADRPSSLVGDRLCPSNPLGGSASGGLASDIQPRLGSCRFSTSPLRFPPLAAFKRGASSGCALADGDDCPFSSPTMTNRRVVYMWSLQRSRGTFL